VKARIALSVLLAVGLMACGEAVDEPVDSVEQHGIGTSPSGPWGVYRPATSWTVVLPSDAGVSDGGVIVTTP
jgi:hypothetical protein